MSWRDELENEQHSNSTVPTKAELIALCERQQVQIQRLNNENDKLNQENQELTNLETQLSQLQTTYSTLQAQYESLLAKLNNE